jgi:acetyltransferase
VIVSKLDHPGDVDVLRFPDGSSLELRPVGVKDGRLLAAMAGHLSGDSEFRRFLAPGKSQHSKWVGRLVAADQVDVLVHGAVATDAFGSVLVAVAESVRRRDRPEWAEVALVAADPWQNMGVGTVLARHLAASAFATGVRFWEAVMLAENGIMARVLHSVGPKVTEHLEPGLVTVVHELTPPGDRPLDT